MKTVLEIVPYHEQKHEWSCVSWGLELILKMHGKIAPEDYPLQSGDNPTGWGFDEKARNELLKHGIQSEEKFLTFSDFAIEMRNQINLGFPPIFSLPAGLIIDSNSALKTTLAFHLWTPILESDYLQYRSRSFGQKDVQTFAPVEEVYNLMRKALKPDYLMHCLLHKKS